MPRMNERARQDWATLRSLHGKKRLEHIWSYYKLPIVIALILFYMAGYAVYRQATKKEDVLYLALVNIAPGDTLTEQQTAGFARDQGLTGKQQVYLYSGLLLSESEGADEEYVYASEMRIVSAITAQRLDVVLMDAEARDAFCRPGLSCGPEQPDTRPCVPMAGRLPNAADPSGRFPRGSLSGGAGQRTPPRARRRLYRLSAYIRKEGPSMDILAIGEILIDLTQTGTGENGIPQFAANPGGAPANLAVAAARLAHRPPLSAR